MLSRAIIAVATFGTLTSPISHEANRQPQIPLESTMTWNESTFNHAQRLQNILLQAQSNADTFTKHYKGTEPPKSAIIALQRIAQNLVNPFLFVNGLHEEETLATVESLLKRTHAYNLVEQCEREKIATFYIRSILTTEPQDISSVFDDTSKLETWHELSSQKRLAAALLLGGEIQQNSFGPHVGVFQMCANQLGEALEMTLICDQKTEQTIVRLNQRFFTIESTSAGEALLLHMAKAIVEEKNGPAPSSPTK